MTSRQEASNSGQSSGTTILLQFERTHMFTFQVHGIEGVFGNMTSAAFFCAWPPSITITEGLIPSYWKHWNTHIKSCDVSPGRKQNPIKNVIPELVTP